jgi:hypothetical protein
MFNKTGKGEQESGNDDAAYKVKLSRNHHSIVAAIAERPFTFVVARTSIMAAHHGGCPPGLPISVKPSSTPKRTKKQEVRVRVDIKCDQIHYGSPSIHSLMTRRVSAISCSIKLTSSG